MNKDETAIRQLLERFMAGETSPQENDQIADWFKSHPMVSDDLKNYQAMFGYLAAGMPWDFAATSEAEEDDTADMVVGDTRSQTAKDILIKKQIKRPWWVGLSAAASIAAAFMVFYPRHNLMPADKYATALESTVDSTAHSASEIFKTPANGNASDTTLPQGKDGRQPLPQKRIYRKHQFNVAPSTACLAASFRDKGEHPDTLVGASASLQAPGQQLAANVGQHYTLEQIEKLTNQALERMLAHQEEKLTEIFGKDPATERLTSQDIELE